ncbi:MAG: hypothetical protein HQM10_12965 [Candidatus Riflebacteria bacterium]|nr:hypothetical protein [Candidatus Riflebacteria bacterium]
MLRNRTVQYLNWSWNNKLSSSGITLIELSISIGLSALLLSGIILLSRHFTASPQKNIARLEICLEAKKVLRRLRHDLYNACFPVGREAVFMNFSEIVTENATIQSPQYEWLVFPDVSFPENLNATETIGLSIQRINKVKYYLVPSIVGNHDFQDLIREETFHQDFQVPPTKTIVSRGIRFLQIKPIEVLDISGNKQSLFQILLQFTETSDGVQKNLEFSELVSPIFWRSFCKKDFLGRNWSTMLEAQF